MNFFNNILIFSLFFLICFIFKWLQISKRTNTVLSTLHSIINTLKNNSLSDTEKQQKLLLLSFTLFKRSSIIGLIIITIIIALFITTGIISYSLYHNLSIIYMLLSLKGIIISSISFIAYFIIQKLYGF